MLKLDHSFLERHVSQWDECEFYQRCLAAVKCLNVINDSAERGVKSSDLLEAARHEDNFQNTIQVVEHNRREMPDLRMPNKK